MVSKWDKIYLYASVIENKKIKPFLKKTKKIELFRPFNFGITFFSSISIFIISFILVCVVAIDFDSAFIVFHHIFFPGKYNWQFNPNEMEIINVLPQQFFMNCAILIVVSIVLISGDCILFGVLKYFFLS